MIQKLKKKFALLQGFGNALFLGGRGLRLGGYMLGKLGRLGLNTMFPFIFKNYVEKTKFFGLPQPHTFNSFAELDSSQSIGKLLFLLDFQDAFTNRIYEKAYNMYMYPTMVKAFSPKKMSSLENVNINRIWECSFFN